MEGHEESKEVYVCTECGASLSEEEYEAHETKTCQTPGCTKHGQPFDKKNVCTTCGADHSAD